MPVIQCPNGATLGIGSLPHRDIADGVDFSLTATTVPTVPSFPRRSPAEGMISQAMVGIDGITVGQYGAISVDTGRIGPRSRVHTDLHHEAFAGFRAFLAATAARVTPTMAPPAAASVSEEPDPCVSAAEPAAEPPAEPPVGPAVGPPVGVQIGTVKWQLVGPVTLGLSLIRAGVPERVAFAVAIRAVRDHISSLLDAVERALPGCTQVVFVDEPAMADLADSGFPLAPDTAIDLVSGALAVIEQRAVSGLHVCGEADWASLLAAGPQVLAVPVRSSLVSSASYIQQFLSRGGVVAWGAVRTDGPIATTAERPWRQLCELWSQLTDRGCDSRLLRQNSVITPECGLGMLTPTLSEHVHHMVTDIGRRVHDQAVAAQFVVGA